jgi:hypothetical protein
VSRRLPALAAVALTVAATLVAPARAQETAPAVELVLMRISPAVGPTAPLTYQVAVRNRGQAPVRDLRVRALLGRPVDTRSELASLVVGALPAGGRPVDDFSAPAGEVGPGTTVRLAARRVALPPGLGAGSPGVVLPLSLELRAASPGGPVADRLATFVIDVPERAAQPLRAALLVPLHEPTHRNPAREFVDDRLAAQLAGGGPLGAIADELARPNAPKVTMVVDAMLVEEATAMAGSWRLRRRGRVVTVPAGDPRSRSAARFLERLKAAASDNPPAAFPYAGADLPALVRAGLDGEASLQIGRDLLRAGLGTAPDETLAWPVDGAIDAAVLQTLAGTGTDVVVLDPRRLPTTATTTQNATVELGGGLLQPQRALVGDPVVSAALADQRAAAAPAEWAQRVLAETAVAWLERPNSAEPRGMLLAPPQAWRPPPAFFTALARGLAGAPWLRLRPATSLADEVPQGPGERRLATVTAADVAAGLPADYLRGVARARSRLTSFRRAAGPEFRPASGDFDRDLMVAESSDWRPAAARARGRAFVRAVDRGIKAVYGKVGVEQNRVTLTARRGTIPITVFNDGDQRLTVTLRLTSPKVDLPAASEPFVLEPRRRATQLLPVGTRATGTFPIVVEVLTPDGKERVAGGEVRLVSTAFNRVALALTGGAAGFLLLWWRLGRRRRAGKTVGGGRDQEDAG